MRKSLLLTILIFLFSAVCLAGNALHEQVLFTQVRVSTSQAGGSGTVIWSRQNDAGFWVSYIITCNHVIEANIKIEDKWNPLLQRNKKAEAKTPINIELFNYDVPHGSAPLTSGLKGNIETYSIENDLALIKVLLPQKPVVATLLPRDKIENVIIGSPAVAVGCALLHDPILTSGIVTHLGDIAGEYQKTFWMSNALTIFGNSGGAAFVNLDGSYYFMGIPSLIDVVYGQAVTHLGYFSPIPRIYDWFEEAIYDFLIPGSKKTESQCEEEREKEREKDEN